MDAAWKSIPVGVIPSGSATSCVRPQHWAITHLEERVLVFFFFFWWGVMYQHLFSFLTEFRNELDAPIFILFCPEDYTLTYRSLLSAGVNQSWTRQRRWGSAGKWKASKASCHLLYIIRPFPCSCSPKHPECSPPYRSEGADSLVNLGLVISYRRAHQ